MTRVDVRPGHYRWARDRARLEVPALTRRFPRLVEWEAGTALPTLKQLEAFAAATYTPLGYFFLPDPPIEAVPIPDFRTVGGMPVGEPSANLLDTIYICQQRQEWYRHPPAFFCGRPGRGDQSRRDARFPAGGGCPRCSRQHEPSPKRHPPRQRFATGRG